MSQQQLATQQVKRTSYPAKKTEMLHRVEELASQYDTIIMTKLFKVRASQLMLLRKNFRSELVMIIAKNKIAGLALGSVKGKSSPDFISKLEGQNALIFTNMNPFKLYLALEKSKVNLPARAGDIASEDIVVPAGNTGIAPGPVLSEFKDAGVQTRIEAGNIFVSRDSVVAKPGDVISPRLAGLLARLNLKPIKAGLSIYAAYSRGLLLLQKDISINLEEYRSNVQRAVLEALGLSVEAGYITKDSLPLMIGRALRSALRVAETSGYITSDNAPDVLGFAEAQAQIVSRLASQKGFSASS